MVGFISGERVQNVFDTFVDHVFIAQYGKRLLCLMKQYCQFLRFLVRLTCSRHRYDLTLRGNHFLI